jgi:hypothetical protein
MSRGIIIAGQWAEHEGREPTRVRKECSEVGFSIDFKKLPAQIMRLEPCTSSSVAAVTNRRFAFASRRSVIP